jgi:hypothetical protein
MDPSLVLYAALRVKIVFDLSNDLSKSYLLKQYISNIISVKNDIGISFLIWIISMHNLGIK